MNSSIESREVKPPGARRDGYVMVLFAMLLFGLMALAALVIDLGFTRLTHRQMQTAADAAALEGLRGQGLASPTFSERQAAAADLVNWTFDDDLDASNGDDGIAGDGGQFGAGPLVEFSGGAGQPGMNASQLIEIDMNSIAYKPVMQSRASQFATNQFRVAIQRGGTIDDEYDLAAVGPAVPFLFGRGTLVNRSRIGAGINVGGVAVAEARPVVHVWPAVPGLANGIQPVAYEVSDWTSTQSSPLTITSNLADGLSIGQPISTGVATPSPPTNDYCAIFDAATMRVIGFGLIGQTVPTDGVVVAQNASPRLSDAWSVLSSLSEADRTSVLSANQALSYCLKAPVLVRRN